MASSWVRVQSAMSPGADEDRVARRRPWSTRDRVRSPVRSVRRAFDGDERDRVGTRVGRIDVRRVALASSVFARPGCRVAEVPGPRRRAVRRLVGELDGERARGQLVGLVVNAAVGTGAVGAPSVMTSWGRLVVASLLRKSGLFVQVLLRAKAYRPSRGTAVAGRRDSRRRRWRRWCRPAGERGAGDRGGVRPTDAGLGPGRVRDRVHALAVRARVGDEEAELDAGHRTAGASDVELEVVAIGRARPAVLPRPERGKRPVIGVEGARVDLGIGDRARG